MVTGAPELAGEEADSDDGQDRGGGGEAVCPILCHERAASRKTLVTAE